MTHCSLKRRLDRIDADVALLRELMRRASRIVLNATVDGTHELRTDVTIIRYPDRYSDPRGAEIWTNVLRLLAQISKKRRKERLMDDTPWHKRRLQELAEARDHERHSDQSHQVERAQEAPLTSLRCSARSAGGRRAR